VSEPHFIYKTRRMGVRRSYGKGTQPLFWAGSQDARGKLSFSDRTNSLNYCVIFIVNT